MADIFAIPFARVQRARGFVADLEKLFDDYLKDDPLVIKGQPFRAPDGALVIDFNLKGMGHAPGLISADAIHNLRASLDLMATELAEINRENPKGVHFPFAESASELDSQIKHKKFHRAGPDAVKLLKTIAPYRGGNIALRALHDLDIQTKHERLLVTPMQQHVRLDFARTSNGEEYVLPVRVEGIKYFCPNASALDGQELIPALEHFVQVVDGVLQSFARLVAARTP